MLDSSSTTPLLSLAQAYEGRPIFIRDELLQGFPYFGCLFPKKSLFLRHHGCCKPGLGPNICADDIVRTLWSLSSADMQPQRHERTNTDFMNPFKLIQLLSGCMYVSSPRCWHVYGFLNAFKSQEEEKKDVVANNNDRSNN